MSTDAGLIRAILERIDDERLRLCNEPLTAEERAERLRVLEEMERDLLERVGVQ